ncbi:MAG: PCRF domain-containing protein, partial [Amnibacterium sp.]
MVQLDYGARLATLRSTLGDVLAVVGVDDLKKRIATLSDQAAAPDLWNDPDAAQKVTSALSHAQTELARITGVQRRLDDLEVLIELVNAEEDEALAAETAAEAESELVGVEATVGELEVQTLLNGEYDPRPAVVTIRAGAGGVDAADFAEML